MKSNTSALHSLLEEHLNLLPEEDIVGLSPFLKRVSQALFEEIELRRVADERIRLSEQKYRRIIEALDIGIIETDDEGCIKKVYKRFSDITGYTEEELIGKDPAKLFLEPGWEERVEEVNAARKRGEAGVWEARIRHKSGRALTMMISGAPIRELDGRITGSIGLHFDVTQHVEREQALREAQEKAEAALKAQEVFLANISHELRTPMNAILGMTQVLLEKADASHQHDLEIIQTSGKELLKIINDLLDIARMNTGQFSVEKQGVNLNDLIQRSFILMNVGARQKQVKLDYRIDERLKAQDYFIDPVRLHQIITNLVSNAIKFTPEEGEVKLFAELRGEHELYIAVSDTGIGIDQDKLDLIFESFRQEDESVTRKYGGTGLGLSITRQLVDALGGQLTVASTKGVGSEFSLTLPVVLAETSKEDGATSQLSRFDEFSLLLVEDNEMNRLVARTILESWGAKVTEVNNGKEALMELRTGAYDLVLMDLQMPEMGGVEATQAIRDELKSAIPIIALTANAIEREREYCLQVGMDAYVSKPLDAVELNVQLDRVLGGSSDALLTEEDAHWQSFVNQFDDVKKQVFRDNLCQSLHDVMPKLETAFANNDVQEIARLVHQLRPTVTYAGEVALARTLAIVELAADQGRMHTVQKCKQGVLEKLNKVLTKLNQPV